MSSRRVKPKPAFCWKEAFRATCELTDAEFPFALAYFTGKQGALISHAGNGLSNEVFA